MVDTARPEGGAARRFTEVPKHPYCSPDLRNCRASPGRGAGRGANCQNIRG